MFKFLLAKPKSGAYGDLVNKGIGRPQQSKTLLAAALGSILLLSGCQQQAEDNVADKSQTSEQTSAEDSQPMAQSDSAAARIEQFQPLYVAQFQRLQGRLQAEYESLQAADASDSVNSLLVDGAEADVNIADSDTTETGDNQPNKSNQASTATTSQPVEDRAVDVASGEVADVNADISTEINTNTEVGERDLTVLKRISLEPRKPVLLTEEQIVERYEQAMEALYQSATTPLSEENIDTLINIATLVPQLFEDAEIAGRVSAKSPALARLIIQHQVWEQIEAQQVLDMQKMKQNQQQEFEMLMAKFNETIEDYDEQIAKYEQTLKEFK
ncbi:MAG TPA: hypothetical protein VLN09_08800 [Psychrobacter sp.]|uniref:hypothetical protein n=1 Tax=Psychrobacter sp. TaxID=56811 RepID=UPI002D03F965|nr:hypothetical protein [Psychrobacter sp.]HSP85819.1 hypothetical protein [Psychrobacter sp.]